MSSGKASAGRNLKIGLTGHRPSKIAPADRKAVRARLETALLKIEVCTRPLFDATPLVVSALAEGADRYGAAAALKAGWGIDVILPFRKARYERDFASKKSRADFAALLKAARYTETLKGEVLERSVSPDEPYAALGRRLACIVDVTVAVWNGEAAAGPGGTAHVMALALADGAPVLWVGIGNRTLTKLLLPSKKAARRDDRDKALRRALQERFAVADAPSELTVDV